jgi:choline kinase
MTFDDRTMTGNAPAIPGLHAIILAAGVGRRLGLEGEDGEPKPKVLLELGGRSLLQRHLLLLEQAGVSSVTIVVGYRAEELLSALAASGTCLDVTTVFNPDFREGSVVSLWAAREFLRRNERTLLMDADVLYDRRMLERLLLSAHEDCLLCDRNIEPGDEPVKLCVRGSTIVDLRKIPTASYDWYGESVGFFRFSPAAAAEMAARVEDYVQTGRRGQEYEEPLRDMIQASDPDRFGFEDISMLPWTEIDFPEDVIKARALLPALVP